MDKFISDTILYCIGKYTYRTSMVGKYLRFSRACARVLCIRCEDENLTRRISSPVQPRLTQQTSFVFKHGKTDDQILSSLYSVSNAMRQIYRQYSSKYLSRLTSRREYLLLQACMHACSVVSELFSLSTQKERVINIDKTTVIR